MIKNGNYYFLNFGEHKDKFINVFTKYFGERNRQIIDDKINTCGYYPYISEEAVTDYYNQYLAKFKDEIIDEFCKEIGVKDPSPEIRNFIMSDEGRSGILTAIVFGDALKPDTLLISDDRKKHHLEVRAKAYRLFGFEEDDFEALQDMARIFDACCRKITQKHKCDVFKDVERLEDNRARLTQAFLTNESFHGIPVTDKDQEIIAKTDFDWIDVENLDCNHVLFTNSIDIPGWISSFTTEADRVLKEGSINEKIRILIDRVRYFYSIDENKDTLSFVSSGELFSKTPIKNVEDFYERLQNQYQVYTVAYPTYNVPPELADKSEIRRVFYAQDIFNGCKFAKNISRKVNDHIQSPNSDLPYLTSMSYTNNNPNLPTADIFFDEGEYYDTYTLLANLIHELNHAMAHGKAHPTSNPKYVKIRDGIRVETIKVEDDGEYLSKALVGSQNNVLLAEENITERMAREMLEIFLKMYENPFEESDIKYTDQDKWITMYDAWNFLTEDFYTRYKSFIKEHRINPDYDMFFIEKIIPSNPVTKAYAKIEEFLRKKFKRPSQVHTSGVVDYKNVEELGNLVAFFKTHVYPVLVEHGVTIDEWNGKTEAENVKRIPMNTRRMVAHLTEKNKELSKTMWSDYKTYASDRVQKERRERMKNTREKNKKYRIKEILTKSALSDMVAKAISEDGASLVDGGEMEASI